MAGGHDPTAGVNRATLPALLAALLLCAAGCRELPEAPSALALARPQMSPDSVVLEVFVIRTPLDDPQAGESLWQGIDEQIVDPQLRKRLTDNGLRIGKVSGHLPLELERLMQLTDNAQQAGIEQQVQVFHDRPRVTKSHKQLRARESFEFWASKSYPELPLLLAMDGQVRGRTYEQAQGLLSVKSQPLPTGQARLEITPGLKHGASRQQFLPEQGQFQMIVGQPTEYIERLRFETDLAPGQLLLVASRREKPGSMGHYFLTQNHDGKLEQQLLVIRLAQTQYMDPFGLTDPAEAKSKMAPGF